MPKLVSDRKRPQQEQLSPNKAPATAPVPNRSAVPLPPAKSKSTPKPNLPPQSAVATSHKKVTVPPPTLSSARRTSHSLPNGPKQTPIPPPSAKSSKSTVPLPVSKKQTPVPVPPKANGKAASNATSSKARQPLSKETVSESEEESESESSSESEPEGSGSEGKSEGSASDVEETLNTTKPDIRKAKETEPESPPVPSDTSEASEQSESEEESEDDNEDASAQPAPEGAARDNNGDVSMSGTSTETDSAPTPPQPVPAPKPLTFSPPTGFKKLTRSAPASSEATKVFQPQSLRGKQLWHITAPSSIPITSVKQVAMENVTKGLKVLEHDGADYRFDMDAAVNTEAAILVLAENGTQFKPVPVNISQTLHLRQMPHLPELSKRQADTATGSDAAASYQIPAAKPVRQQPKGLKMRFRPAGFGDESPGNLGSDSSDFEADAEAAQSRPAFQPPKTPVPVPEKQSKAEKRKHKGKEGDEVEQPKKKKKAVEDPAKAKEATTAEVSKPTLNGITAKPAKSSSAVPEVAGTHEKKKHKEKKHDRKEKEHKHEKQDEEGKTQKRDKEHKKQKEGKEKKEKKKDKSEE